MEFMELLADIQRPVAAELAAWLPDKEPRQHYAMVRDYPARPGKYLRPALILLACEVFGGEPKKAVRTAAAYEAGHEWILIHDDIEDHSEERRGRPCLHKLHGEELAINAGDTLHMIMWKMLWENRSVLGPELTFKVLDEVYDILLTTAEGQFIEVSWIRDKKIELTEADYYSVIDRKAGLYTITGPMRLGGLIAGATAEQLKAIDEFGLPFGRAFQIQDDVLNLTAGAAYGKEIAGDIAEGKRTLMLVHLLQHCTPDEKRKIVDIHSKPRAAKSGAEVRLVLDLMKKHGSIEYAKRRAAEFVKQAQTIFDNRFAGLPETKAKAALRAAIEFVAAREL